MKGFRVVAGIASILRNAGVQKKRIGSAITAVEKSRKEKIILLKV